MCCDWVQEKLETWKGRGRQRRRSRPALTDITPVLFSLRHTQSHTGVHRALPAQYNLWIMEVKEMRQKPGNQYRDKSRSPAYKQCTGLSPINKQNKMLTQHEDIYSKPT